MIAVYIGIIIQIYEDGPLSLSALGFFCTFVKYLLYSPEPIEEKCVDSIKHAIAVYPPAVSVGAVPVLDVAKMPNGKSP